MQEKVFKMQSRRSVLRVALSFVALIAMHGLAAAQEVPAHGTGLMARQALGIGSVLGMSGAALCVQAETRTELDIANYFKTNSMEYSPVRFATLADVFAAYDAGRCDAVAADASELDAARLTLKNPNEHVVLPERLGTE